jgi:predicted AlkP superfamily pyrophosphatase or phosphodiesterase
VDALGYRFVSEKTTPYLWRLAEAGFKAPLKSILGYSDAIRATIFTGTYPDRHNYWIMYKFSPNTSPFKIFNHLKVIDHIPVGSMKRATKFALSNALCKIIAKKHGYCSLSTHNIPFKIIEYFDYTLKKPMTSKNVFNGISTLLDILAENGVKCAYISSADLGWMNYFGSSRKIQEKLPQILRRLDKDNRLIYVYLHHLDHFAHRYGVNSRKFLEELNSMDETVRLIVNEARQQFGNKLGVIILSDHGMTDTIEFVSFERLIKDETFGRDYLFFLDSTMVRLWYLNEDRREEVQSLFEKLSYGSFLTSKQKKELRIDFKHRYYGDDILLLKPGYSVFPNFMSWFKPKSMHAYHPNHESQLGIFIATGNYLRTITPNIEYVRLIDIMPTVLRTLDLRVPETCDGRSLIG